MDCPITKETVVALIFAAGGIGALITLWVWHRSDKTTVDLTDLLMENGRLSRLAVTWLGSFAVMTFGYVYMLIKGTLTDTHTLIYSAVWAVPIITKMFAIKPELPGVPKP